MPTVDDNVTECSGAALAAAAESSRLRETARMLQLAAGQVEAAMRESNAAVAVLTDTFTSMAEALDTIDVSLGTLPPSVGNEMVTADIHDRTRLVAQKVQQSIIAFQFYDKLVQRLSHVCQDLGALSELIGDRDALGQCADWAGLHQAVRARYTMNEERALFDAVMNGASVAQALQAAAGSSATEAEASAGDIELF